MRIHLRGWNIHRLLAHERSALIQTGGNGDIRHLAYNHRVLIDVAAYRTRSAIKLARKGSIHDGNLLCIWTVRIGKGAACQYGHLQSIEISGRHIDNVCSILLPSLCSVAEGDCIVQCALIGQGECDGGVLHAGNPPHGRGAHVQ